jgi:hypothetical protein
VALNSLLLVADLQVLLVTVGPQWSVGSAYLGSEVEPEVWVVGKAVLNKQRNLVAEAKLDLTAEARGFAEVDEVLEREGKGDGLSKADLDVLLLVLDVGVLAKGDGTVADVTSAGELYALLCALNGDYATS